jgi:DNA-binding GntR family transcriptional regulator
VYSTLSDEEIRRRPGLAEQVYNALRRSISGGKLRPGERLVVDRLAVQLRVSPTPVREALARLIQEGLVEEGAHGKLHMVPITPGYVADIFLVRASLEGLAAELAAPRISAAQLASLRDDLTKTSAALAMNDYRPHIGTDQRLHRVICDAAGNVALSRELQSLQLHTDYIRGFSQRHSGDHIRLSHADHLALLAALERRDPSAARVAMEQHIRAASERITRLIDFHRTEGLRAVTDVTERQPIAGKPNEIDSV